MKNIEVSILSTMQSINKLAISLLIKVIHSNRLLVYALFNMTFPFAALYNAVCRDLRKEAEPGTINETCTNLLISLSRSFAEHLPFVMKVFINLIYLKSLSSGSDILIVQKFTI